MTAVTHEAPGVAAAEPHRPTQTHAEVTRDILNTLKTPDRTYYLALFGAIAAFLVGLVTFVLLLKDGLGLAGYQPPVMWNVYITNFVFWIGIGHAGTLISAILFLFRSPWRTVVYRSTEAMTVFAVMTAALFPIIHIGRQWIFYWLLPYPNQRFLWPNFKSPLLWDVFAITTYFTVSTTFLIVGLVPDVAAVRDKLTGWRQWIYRQLSVGWTGASSQWRHYTRGYLYLAALATVGLSMLPKLLGFDQPARTEPVLAKVRPIAVITALSVMQASGGLDYLLELAESVLRKSPGRVTLLGDACHPALPFLAQGAAMALEDGYILARALEAADGDIERGLTRYEDARKERTARVVHGSAETARRFHNPALSHPENARAYVDREWSEERVNDRLKDLMEDATDMVLDRAHEAAISIDNALAFPLSRSNRCRRPPCS